MSDTYDPLPELAVALNYDGENTPRVTAKGRGELAEEILKLAQESGIPLEKDSELAAILAQIPLGDEIPEALYRAIAEVIAFAYMLTGKRPSGFRDPKEEPKSL
ncbi:MAG: EscU/YscU/HrcU family type III secretion system export apparatus switch protein [Sedimenticola sp.]